MKRMLWILNPHAGRGAMSGKIIGCVTAFQQAGYDVTIYITQVRRMQRVLRGSVRASSIALCVQAVTVR